MESSSLGGEKNMKFHGFPLYALVLSLLLHGVALGLLSPWPQDTAAALLPVPLQGRLLPAPAATPAAAKPAPGEAAPSPAPLAQAAPPAAVAPAPSFAGTASPGAGEAAGGTRAQAAGMPANVAPADARREEGPDAAGLRQFRLALAGEARRLRNYPEAARRAGLAGTVEVRVAVDAGGALRRADLTRTSGHALLDTAALEMLREAAGRTALPESLRGLSFAVLLPVVFEVED